MSQQINLLDASLSSTRDWLNLRNMVLAALGVFVFIGLSAGWGMYREKQEAARFRASEARLKQAQESLTALAGVQAGRHIDPALEQELDKTRKAAEATEAMAALLEQGGLGNRLGFSAVMAGIARQVEEGVWITGFDLAEGGQQMEIRGNVLREPALPRLITRLQDEEVFKGRHFSTLTMKRVDPLAAPANGNAAPPEQTPAPAAALPYVEFVLSGLVADQDKKAASP